MKRLLKRRPLLPSSRLAASLALLGTVVGAAFAQAKAVSIYGTWVVDSKAADKRFLGQALSLTFSRDGTVKLSSKSVQGLGRFKLNASTGSITLIKRNGVKPGPKERNGRFRVIENGRALLVESGAQANGIPQMVRLIRKR